MDVQVGLQLYSVRQSLARDPWATLAEIAAAVTRPRPAATEATPYGDGRAAARVVEVLRTRAR